MIERRGGLGYTHTVGQGGVAVSALIDARVPTHSGGIDLDFRLDRLPRQTDENREKGFCPIKMKVGRPRLSRDLERAGGCASISAPPLR